MSNYSKTTDFEAKDSLPTGDSGKIIRGAEFETEFDAISTAIATKADTAGPTFTGTLTFETISDGTIGVTAFVDEDDMSSDSATLVPTQQSVKAYVDSQVTAQDLDFQADSGGALSIDLDSETMTFTGGTGIDTSGSGNAVTFAIDSTVATLTGTQTLTNKTLTSPDVNTPDIDGGTIDGTVIGGTTPAAVSATTVSATGNITVGGTVDGRDVATDGTKLDGIEAGATADQTAAEIRTLVDSATDSNVFTDADHTKLDGIEASADVTDTANVTAAGAVMDSELTNETAVKALNQGVATTDSPTFAGVTVNGTVEFDGLSGTGAVSVTDILDQDDMSSNSATALATQQSIKAYVDSQVATADTLAEVLANGNTTGGTDVAFGDNDKAIFGAGSDLEIYHDGSNSYVADVGTGNLLVQADNFVVLETTAGANYFQGQSGGASTIYYSGSPKLDTTSTGIDVTGTLVSDGLTVDGLYGSISDTQGHLLKIDAKSNGANPTLELDHDLFGAGYVRFLADRSSGDLRIFTNGLLRQNIGTGGNISFYEDTGTTAKFFWDASTERLGIGNSSPTTALDVTGTVTADGLNLADGGDRTITGPVNNDLIINSRGNTPGEGTRIQSSGSDRLVVDDTTGDISFYEDTGTTAKFFWDASAESLGIGTSSPSSKLHVQGTSYFFDQSIFGDKVGIGTSSPATRLDVAGGVNSSHATFSGQAGRGLVISTENTLNNDDGVSYNAQTSSGQHLFKTNGTERMRIDSNGRVGIGTTPVRVLDIATTTGGTIIHLTDDATGHTATDGVDLQQEGTLFQILNREAGDIRFGTDNTERMRIDSNGDVGIGVTSPDATLTVSSGSANNVANFKSTDGTAYIAIADNSTTSVLHNQIGAIGDNMFFATNDTERMRITSGGALEIGPTGNKVIIKSQASFQNTTLESHIINANGLGAYGSGDLLIQPRCSSVSSNNIVFGTSGGTNTTSERMRIDSSGTLLVGTTDTTLYNNTTGGGFSVSSNGFTQIAKQGADSADPVLILNQTGLDGEIQRFYKDGTIVGNIGAKGGTAYIAGAVKGLRLSGSGVIPVDTTGTNSDATYDIGDQDVRFKDLYLSGTVNANYINSGSDTNTFINFAGSDIIRFGNGGSESARFNGSNNLQVGHTNTDNSRVSVEATSVGVAMHFRRNTTTYTTSAVVGSITCDSVSTGYNTSSDQRLKDNIVDAPSASDDIDAIQVRSFDWKADGSHQKYGMVAQELQSVAPEAVTGDADSDDMMGVDYSKLVPMLVKEIQSLRARVAQLEGEN